MGWTRISLTGTVSRGCGDGAYWVSQQDDGTTQDGSPHDLSMTTCRACGDPGKPGWPDGWGVT